MSDVTGHEIWNVLSDALAEWAYRLILRESNFKQAHFERKKFNAMVFLCFIRIVWELINGKWLSNDEVAKLMKPPLTPYLSKSASKSKLKVLVKNEILITKLFQNILKHGLNHFAGFKQVTQVFQNDVTFASNPARIKIKFAMMDGLQRLLNHLQNFTEELIKILEISLPQKEIYVNLYLLLNPTASPKSLPQPEYLSESKCQINKEAPDLESITSSDIPVSRDHSVLRIQMDPRCQIIALLQGLARAPCSDDLPMQIAVLKEKYAFVKSIDNLASPKVSDLQVSEYISLILLVKRFGQPNITPLSTDYGKDIVVTGMYGMPIIIELKRQGQVVNVAQVSRVVHACLMENAPGGILISFSGFSPQAYKERDLLFKRQGIWIEFWDGDYLDQSIHEINAQSDQGTVILNAEGEKVGEN